MTENKGFKIFIRIASIAVLVLLSPLSLFATFMIILGTMPPGGPSLASVFAAGTLLATVSAIINLFRVNIYSVLGLFIGALLWYLGLH